MHDIGLVIPRSELDKLEEARKELWGLYDELDFTPQQFANLQKATQVMWRLTHRKWPINQEKVYSND